MRRRRVKNALHDQQLLIERDHLAYALEWWTAKQAQPPTDEELMRAAHQYLTERVQGLFNSVFNSGLWCWASC